MIQKKYSTLQREKWINGEVIYCESVLHAGKVKYSN